MPLDLYARLSAQLLTETVYMSRATQLRFGEECHLAVLKRNTEHTAIISHCYVASVKGVIELRLSSATSLLSKAVYLKRLGFDDTSLTRKSLSLILARAVNIIEKLHICVQNSLGKTRMASLMVYCLSQLACGSRV